MVGNGTSPTSATTASLSGTSQTSLNSSGSSSRLRSNLDQKKASAPPASSSAANETSEQCKAKIEVEEHPSAPIATINDEDFKLDGGETTKVCNY